MKKLLIALFLFAVVLFSCESTEDICWKCTSESFISQDVKTEIYCGDTRGKYLIEEQTPERGYLDWECNEITTTNTEVK